MMATACCVIRVLMSSMGYSVTDTASLRDSESYVDL